ncbi:hypothetical protein HHI36_013101 [Cryptolaemus montrouzieri]|uniref:Uncharacterized protein n=1 Tax=Cryptolaemus montrouzieri TaxID=559131 RepID=A0ABD2NG44_9CUCU
MSNDGEIEHIRNIFRKNLLMYVGVVPEKRRKIPRMSQSRAMEKTVSQVNNLIADSIQDVTSLTDLLDIVYVGAVIVCERHRTIPTSERRTAVKGQLPP